VEGEPLVPGGASVEDLRRRVDELTRPEPVDRFLSRVHEVIIVACSYRGGSTLLAELLRHSRDLLHLSVEIHGALQLAGLGFPDSGTGCDRLDATHAQANLSVLERELAHDIGQPVRRLALDGLDRFISDLTWRLVMQWPQEAIAEREVSDHVRRTLRDPPYLDAGINEANVERFNLEVLRKLQPAHHSMNPYCYDIAPAVVAQAQPDGRCSPGPHSPVIGEMTPLTLARPWRHASSEEIATKPLVIKTAANAHRLPFLKALFPNAHFRVIHLVRNPAAAINSLHDGWLSHWFFHQRVDVPLAIQGYSDAFPWGGSWWKFGFHPGWMEAADRPLVEICAQQWRTAHTAVLDFAADTDADLRRIRYEDLIGPAARRQQVFEGIAVWLGMERAALHHLSHLQLAPLNATHQPRIRRWQANRVVLEQVLKDESIHDTARSLGYGTSIDTWW
jgi:hypothetical protein